MVISRTQFSCADAPGSPANESKPRVLFVDDEMNVLNSLRRFSRNKPWTADLASSTEEALRKIEDSQYNVVVSDMRMPLMTGDKFLSLVREKTPHSTRILLSGYSDISAISSAVNKAKIFNYVTKPWDEKALTDILVSAIEANREATQKEDKTKEYINKSRRLGKVALLLNERVKASNSEAKEASAALEDSARLGEEYACDLLHAMIQMVEWKSGRDAGRTHFVNEYSRKVARALHLPPQEQSRIHLAARLHRTGTIYLPVKLRNKALFELSADERRSFLQHAIWGEALLSNTPRFKDIAKIVRHQNEYADGSGFPDNLSIHDIPFTSRIITVVGDFFDACNGTLAPDVNDIEEAKKYLKQWDEKKYDPLIVDVFLRVIHGFEGICPKKIKLDQSNLLEGMILSDDILDKNSTILLTRGTMLDRKTISQLNKLESTLNRKLEVSVYNGEQ